MWYQLVGEKPGTKEDVRRREDWFPGMVSKSFSRNFYEALLIVLSLESSKKYT